MDFYYGDYRVIEIKKDELESKYSVYWMEVWDEGVLGVLGGWLWVRGRVLVDIVFVK